jgi:predicted secreted acid phosphatase
VAKEASKRWKELDAEAKAVYEDKNKADKVRYETEMKAYTAKQAASGADLDMDDDDDDLMG